MYAGEVRAALLRMPEAERTKAIQAAINDGDDQFAAAAITGNVVLTGLGKAQHAAYADAWKRTRHKNTVERIECLRGGLDGLTALAR